MPKLILFFLITISFTMSHIKKQDITNSSIAIDRANWSVYENFEVIELNFYKVYYDENRHNAKWIRNIVGAEVNGFVSDEISFIYDESKGYLLVHKQSPFSGDWFRKTKLYYDNEGKLTYVFSELHTYQSMKGPLIVIFKINYNKQGEIISRTKDILSMDNKKKIKIKKHEFFSPDIDIWTNIQELPFRELINN